MENINFTQRDPTKIINKRIKSFTDGYRKNLALLGDDKSQIIHYLTKHLSHAKSEELTYIYANASYVGDKDLFKNVSFSVLNEYLRCNEPLDALITIASDVLPLTTDFIKENLRTKGPITFIKVLELINKFINETSRKCILIIEEFTELKRIFKNFHQDFSQFIIFQKKCMIIITSSDINIAQRILSSELNLLFGNFEEIHLNENTFLDNYLHFKGLLEPLKPSPLFMSFFINLLGTNITYYNIIAEYIQNYYGPDENKSIITVVKHALFDEGSYFSQKFITRIEFLKDKFKDYIVFLKLLVAICTGYIRKKEIISLNISKSKNLLLKLQKLTELGYLDNHGDVYKIKDDLFAFWLSHVFCFYSYPNILDQKKKLRLFESKLNETIEEFHDSFFKEKIKRVIELISSFKDDSLKIGKQRIRLPRIEKTKIISSPERKMNFLIGEGRKIIFVGIKEESADDIDILDYIEKISIFKGRNIQRIFITLNNFSASAKLIAKENRLTTWDVNDINHLLNIYSKPVIINENTGDI